MEKKSSAHSFSCSCYLFYYLEVSLILLQSIFTMNYIEVSLFEMVPDKTLPESRTLSVLVDNYYEVEISPFNYNFTYSLHYMMPI